LSSEAEDPINRFKRGEIVNSADAEDYEREWTVLEIGGMQVRSSPHGNLTIYEIIGDDLTATMANSVDQGWADLLVDVGRHSTVLLSPVSLQVPNGDADGYVYLCIGMDPDDPEMYPLVEIRLHRRIALYLFGALFTMFEGEPDE
jgi:hypothetical protein